MSSKLQVTTLGDLELEMTRTFDAPLALVWDCHTQAEHIKHWWGRGHNLDVELDFRVGGKWRFVEHGEDGQEWAFRGEFREIVPQEVLVWTFEFEGMPGHISVDRLVFTERDGKTTITARSTFDSQSDRDGMVNSGMEQGAEQSYQALDAYLAKLQ
jgi:uncharacterized protein YndB with AHSA1/START domain